MDERIVSHADLPQEKEAERSLRPRSLRSLLDKNSSRKTWSFHQSYKEEALDHVLLYGPGLVKPHWLILSPGRWRCRCIPHLAALERAGYGCGIN